jgi:ParB/RepB/Spo0J family partition protein
MDYGMALAKTEALPKEHLPLRIERKLVRPNQFNPRNKFDREDLSDLLPNIAAVGIKDALLVRPVPKDDEGHIYEAVDGDRRLRAAEQLKIAKIDVWVKNLTDTQVMEDGIIFNKFRRNIGPVEIGRTLSILWKSPEHEMKSLTKFAHDMGYSKGDASRLMALPDGLMPEVQELVAPEGKDRKIPEGSIDRRTAYYLTRIPKGERQVEVTEAIRSTPKLRGDRVGRVVEEARQHPDEPAAEIIEKLAKRVEYGGPTITMSLEDYEKIEQGKKTTVIVRGSTQPGVRANVEITPLVRGKPKKVSDVYKRNLSKFKDRDAERDGYNNLDELKAAWTERYGEWPDDEMVSIIQFYSAEQLKSD